MIIRDERIIVDTNVWILGLRRVPAYPACAALLDNLGELHIAIPRQILQELRANLREDELRAFFDLVKPHQRRIALDWQKVPVELIRKYESFGCKRGDAVVAAHVEALAVPVLVTENQELLTGVSGLPFRIETAQAILAQLE